MRQQPDASIRETFAALPCRRKLMVVGILVALFLGVVVAFTVGILNHQLDKWVEENPRPVNSICDMSIPIPPSKQWGDFTDEQSTTKEEYKE